MPRRLGPGVLLIPAAVVILLVLGLPGFLLGIVWWLSGAFQSPTGQSGMFVPVTASLIVLVMAVSAIWTVRAVTRRRARLIQ